MTGTPTNKAAHRLSFVFLIALPFVAIALAARALRVPGLHQTIGAVVFLVDCLALWTLIGRVGRAGDEPQRQLAFAGGLLVSPFFLISLLWVGLATPWDATPAENQMRYLVLLAGAAAVTGGFIALKELLHEAGERLCSTVGFGAAVMAGSTYLVWLAIHVGAWTSRARSGETPAAMLSLNDSLDTLLFVACVLTYLGTAAFAASLRRVGWIGHRAGLTTVFLSLGGLLLIVLRGLSFPDPAASSTPWYTRPGFIAGIPAVPWILPHIIGVMLLRRARANQP